MAQLSHGVIEGKRWIAGEVPLKRGVSIKIDTRTGLGVDKVLESLADAISWQASKIHLPAYGTDDIIQELNLIALAAIPDYDIDRETNICTFLQSHLQKRALNLYKFATERRRTALHENYRPCKIKCPDCKRFFSHDAASEQAVKCHICGLAEDPAGKKWRRFPLQINTFSASERVWLDGKEEEGLSLQDLFTYETTLEPATPYVEALIGRIAIQEAYSKQDDKNRLIMQHILDGQHISEVCKMTGMSMSAVRSRIAKIGKEYS